MLQILQSQTSPRIQSRQPSHEPGRQLVTPHWGQLCEVWSGSDALLWDLYWQATAECNLSSDLQQKEQEQQFSWKLLTSRSGINMMLHGDGESWLLVFSVTEQANDGLLHWFSLHHWNISTTIGMDISSPQRVNTNDLHDPLCFSWNNNVLMTVGIFCMCVCVCLNTFKTFGQTLEMHLK